jgi:hypothetical protein
MEERSELFAIGVGDASQRFASLRRDAFRLRDRAVFFVAVYSYLCATACIEFAWLKELTSWRRFVSRITSRWQGRVFRRARRVDVKLGKMHDEWLAACFALSSFLSN